MAKKFGLSPMLSEVQFGGASFDLLSDFLINLNNMNKDKLDNLSKCSGYFKHEKLIEYIFLITEMLNLDPVVGYHAIEIHERFMIKHLEDLFSTPIHQGAAAARPVNYEDVVFEKLKETFTITIFSCVQLASKLSLHSHNIDYNTAVQFLHLLGQSISRETLLESELRILKGLEFRLNVPNPLTYVELLLEVLGHNASSIAVERLLPLCRQVLQFICLQRAAIYDSLLMVSIQCCRPSLQQREKFLPVTEDCMLLGVGTIAVATYIISMNTWLQVVEELSHITGTSQRSIRDFAHVTLMHITMSNSPNTLST